MPATAFGKPLTPSLRQGGATSGLVLALPLHERGGTVVADLSGRNNGGTLIGSVTWSAGPHGPCLATDGTPGSYVNCGKGPALTNLAVGPCTWEFWYRAVGTGGVCGKNDDNAVAPGWWIAVIAAGLSIEVEASSANAVRTSDLGGDLNVWTHGVITTDGGLTAANLHIYVNGVEGSYAATTNGSGSRGTDAAHNFVVGKQFSVSGANSFNGEIGGLTVYNRVLPPAEIAGRYADSFAVYRPAWQVVSSTPTPVGLASGVIWNERSAVGSSEADFWNAAAAVGGTNLDRWGVTATAGSTDQWLWSSLLSVGRLGDNSWGVLATAGTTGAESWDVAASVSAVSSADGLLWDVRRAVGSVGHWSWNTSAAVAHAGSGRWDVTTVVGAAGDGVWQVREIVGGFAGHLSWSTGSAVGLVSQAAWDAASLVSGSVSADARLVWQTYPYVIVVYPFEVAVVKRLDLEVGGK